MIPIDKYISITNKIANDAIGDRDFSALIFSKVAMKTGASKKTDYETTLKPITLYADEVSTYFDDDSFVAYLNNYFGYNGGTKKPTCVTVAFVGASETAADAYARVTEGTSTVDAFCNFGAFTFYGSFERGSEGGEGLLDTAIANEKNIYGWAMVVKTDADNQSADSTAYAGDTLVHLTRNDWEALAWYASVDYGVENSAGTIDFKQFANSTATVSTASDKATADSLKVNYVGKVQTYGTGISFYQTGVNMDGTDLGVIRDACWINSVIAKNYLNLQASVQKIPANASGCAMVRNVIIAANNDAITAGAILLDKPLTVTQRQTINSYAGTSDGTAASEVASAGYYVATKIVQESNKYYVKYTNIYAKGDHIQKVEGLHVLV